MTNQHSTTAMAIRQGQKMIERPFKILMLVSTLVIASLFALRFLGWFALSNMLIPLYGILVLFINQKLKSQGSQHWQLWVLLHTEDLHTAEREGIRRDWLGNRGLKDRKVLKQLGQDDRLKTEKRLAGLQSNNQHWQDVVEIPWEMAYYVEKKQVTKEIRDLMLMILAPVALYAFLWMSFAGYLWVKVGLGAIFMLYIVSFIKKIIHYRTLARCNEPMLAANSEEIKYYNGRETLHLPWKNLESVLLQGKDLKVIFNDDYLKTTKNQDKTEHLALNFLYIPHQENFESLLDFYQQRFIKYRKGQDFALAS
ncbi:hypothetical protein [Microscilla marina]|uniref:Uncharacterized protein n=1 Tax=Microscilla marina ATCC 23134 TaxID=313606 RepID=A1ZHA5_MICM2|nr:hypothetical protein [Microscilla marina]EAY30374.1 hypothetical protein M23134_08203 [Microscilla marina ATCC 23134]